MFRRHGIVASGWRLQVVSVFTITMMSLSSGCSRVVSPPGQSVFARPGQSLDQNEGQWNMAGQRPANPSTTGAAYSQNLGDGTAPNSKMLSEKDRLDQQYAQSARLVRAEPPRLIPIEPMEFPGAPEVVDSTSSTAIATTGAGKMVVFSDAPSTPKTMAKTMEQSKFEIRNGTVEQAKLVQDEKKKAVVSESVVPATLIATPEAENKVALASGVENLEETKSSYHQPGRSESKSDSGAFNPDAFAADRRAVPATDKQDDQTNKENSFSDSFGKIKVVKSENKTPSTESSPKAAVSSDPAVAAKSNSKPSLPEPGPKVAPAPVSQDNPAASETSSDPAVGNDAQLDAAGIKVDKNAFDFSPAKKMPAESPSKSGNSNSTDFNSKVTEKSKGNSTSEFSALEYSALEYSASSMKAVADQVANKTNEPKPFKDTAMATLTANQSPEKFNGQFSASPTESKTPVCEKGKSANCISLEELSKANWVALPEASPEKTVETACASSSVPANGACEAGKTCETDESCALPKLSKPNTDFLPLNQPKSISSGLEKSELERPIPSSFAPSLPMPAGFTSVEKVDELKISNPCFCTEIKGFGQVTRFPNNIFKGNQKTLIYCEVENYSSTEEPGANSTVNFVTRLEGRYEILDSRNQTIQTGKFPDIEDTTNRKRRDFYLYFPVAFKDLAAGDYELKVWIEEKGASQASSERTATNSLRFTVGK